MVSKHRLLLGPFAYDVLLILAKNPEANYGGAICTILSMQAGAVQTTLKRMEVNGLVTSTWSEPLQTRGGRRRRLFSVTERGRQAISYTQAHFKKP